MAEIIPFPSRTLHRGERPVVPMDSAAPQSPHESRSGAARYEGIWPQTEQKIHDLSTNFFWVINEKVPDDRAELDRIVTELHTAVMNISCSLGGPRAIAERYLGAVRIFLSCDKMEWKPDRYDQPELFLLNSANALEIEAFIRANDPYDAWQEKLRRLRATTT